MILLLRLAALAVAVLAGSLSVNGETDIQVRLQQIAAKLSTQGPFATARYTLPWETRLLEVERRVVLRLTESSPPRR